MFNYYEIHNCELEVVHQKRAVRYDTHMHNELELFYVMKGEQDVEAGDKKYCVHEGECLAIFPNVRHKYTRAEEIPKDNNCAETVMIFVPSEMLYGLNPRLCAVTPENCLVSADKIEKKVRLCFEMIFEEEMLSAQIGWAQVILSHIIPKLGFSKISERRNPEMVSLVMRYVSENYRESLSLDHLSEILGISKFTISRIFTDKIKMSFRSYLGMLRSNHAAQLINIKNGVLSEIAEESGFESTRSFYRVFKEVYGVSPATYRKMVRTPQRKGSAANEGK